MSENVEVKAEELSKIADAIKDVRSTVDKKGEETQALRDKQEKLWEAHEAKMDELTKAREEEAKARKAESESVEAKLAALGASITKAGAGSPADESATRKALAHKGMLEWMRSGKHPVDQGAEVQKAWQDEVEGKTLTVGNNAEGGVFIDPEFTTEIQKNIREFSKVRAAGARVSSTSSGQLRIPVRNSFTSGTWVGETQTPRGDESQPGYAQEVITTHEQSVLIPISRQLLDEAAINFESEISGEGAEALAANEGAAFTTGDGNGKPNGFLNDTRVSSQDTAASNTLDADDLFDVAYDNLKTDHFNMAKWGCHRTWIKRFRKLKSSATGEYLLEFSDRKALTEGSNLTLLGRPVIEMPDMPAATGTDGGKKAFVLANWSKFYWIVDSLGMTMIRDPFSAKGSGAVEFQMFARTGGKVTLPEAGVILTIAV